MLRREASRKSKGRGNSFTVERTVSRLISDRYSQYFGRASCLGTYDLLGVRGAALESVSAGCRRTFLRLSFCASLLLRRFFSPGFSGHVLTNASCRTIG